MRLVREPVVVGVDPGAGVHPCTPWTVAAVSSVEDFGLALGRSYVSDPPSAYAFCCVDCVAQISDIYDAALVPRCCSFA